MMLWKNRNRTKSVSMWPAVVASCLVLAFAWAILATPETALAKKPVKPPGGGGGGEVGQEIAVGIVFDGTG